jgi:alpha-D-ribose 1-methylphosphonate 5-phosphate C-P lyase
MFSFLKRQWSALQLTRQIGRERALQYMRCTESVAKLMDWRVRYEEFENDEPYVELCAAIDTFINEIVVDSNGKRVWGHDDEVASAQAHPDHITAQEAAA